MATFLQDARTGERQEIFLISRGRDTKTGCAYIEFKDSSGDVRKLLFGSYDERRQIWSPRRNGADSDGPDYYLINQIQ